MSNDEKHSALCLIGSIMIGAIFGITVKPLWLMLLIAISCSVLFNYLMIFFKESIIKFLFERKSEKCVDNCEKIS
jgi:hypothetical protein